jgi:hypothetical protein
MSEQNTAVRVLIAGAGWGRLLAEAFVAALSDADRQALAALETRQPGDLQRLLGEIADRQRPPTPDVAAGSREPDQVRVRGKKRGSKTSPSLEPGWSPEDEAKYRDA